MIVAYVIGSFNPLAMVYSIDFYRDASARCIQFFKQFGHLYTFQDTQCEEKVER